MKLTRDLGKTMIRQTVPTSFQVCNSSGNCFEVGFIVLNSSGVSFYVVETFLNSSGTVFHFE